MNILLIIKFQSTESTDWKKIVNKVNSANGVWQAGLNFPHFISSDRLKKLMGTILETHEDDKENNSQDLFVEYALNESIPDEFDSRENWPECKDVINHIRDQGPCGSCWAVAAASTFSDRICIAKKNLNDTRISISAEDILSCSFFGGCGGGFLRVAWWRIKHRGVVTGGDFNSKLGCKPYSLQPCQHHSNGSRPHCLDILAKTPRCPSQCTNSDYTITLNKDRYKAKDYFSTSGEKNIQKAILSGGPVEAGFVVYEDFLTYKSGVYHHITGKILGGHAVKILGWGVEKGVPYWTCANSWNSDWGDSGFFKILRGKNEVRIESSVFSGII